MWGSASVCVFFFLCVAVHGHLRPGYFRIDKDNTTKLTPSDNGLDVFREGCMRCICQVEGCERNIGKCQMDVGSLSCGPFQIKDNYWIDCYKPGGDWQSCTKQMGCSVTCVNAYMTRYGRYCTGGREPTCQDYSRIHNGGPHGCRPHTGQKERNLEIYWAKVQACCSKYGNC